jgi:hypothetical protein
MQRSISMAREIFRRLPVVLLFASLGCAGAPDAADFKASAGTGTSSGGCGGNGPLVVGAGSGAAGGVLTGAGIDGGGSVPGQSVGVAQNCPSGGSTAISGTVYDPALEDPLYNITVYVPVSATLPDLASGASCNACASLYPPVRSSAVTDPTGHFVIPNAPWGANIPLVVQTGKWRMEFMLPSVTACKDNPQPDKTLRLPRNSTEGHLPDMAISTGGADSLECLPLRMGLDASEYAAGAAATGHIHIFTGYNGASTVPASPASYQSLWDSTQDLMKYDLTLLSCEGQETHPLTVQNQQSMVDYTAAGGRVFASHFHYAWFNTGPFGADNLARWTTGAQEIDDTRSFPGDVITTLASGVTFPEGVALQQWLGTVMALTNGQLPIWFARHNADVGPMNQPPSQPWIELDPSVGPRNAGATQYFSFDTPIGASQACGRVVYSDLHVSGGPNADEPGVAPDYPQMPPTRGMRGGGGGMFGGGMFGGGGSATNNIVPTGCASHPLTPQEKALEFMIFDLSSCLIPVGKTAVPATPPPILH